MGRERFRRSFCNAAYCMASALFLLVLPAQGQSWCLTIEEAMDKARENFPAYMASRQSMLAAKARYKASLSPYVPTLDTTALHEHHQLKEQDYDLSAYDVTLSYTLYDGGRRKANREIARLDFEIDREESEKTLLDLRYDVKSAFYGAMAGQKVVEQRRVQLHDASKDLEVAQGRHRLGVARLSDALQATVRLEQARYNLVQAEGDLRKSVSELNSLIGRPLDGIYDLDGSLEVEPLALDMDRLSAASLQRPEVKQAESAVKVSRNNRALETAAFFPTISASASYTRTEGGPGRATSNDDKVVEIRATWNIFELGKIYRKRAWDYEINASEARFEEVLRQLRLNLDQAHQDYLTACKSLGVAREQLRQAEYNYEQAFGEYRVGKADILSLVQAESLLANAREQMTTSRLSLILARSLLERVTGLNDLSGE